MPRRKYASEEERREAKRKRQREYERRRYGNMSPEERAAKIGSKGISDKVQGTTSRATSPIRKAIS